ncbi:hypothetical protein BBO99_00001511 [Phytophthora kernoviae]|uniref:Uncharacterized protein n=1 Tax=Phytophthora kernoviae TaxID=325452 RepID=A0A3R7JY07_9STRA|nr:hypothetical protein JM18_004251 [Phytophthora kernoviae]RLN20313.1 hypothetical protein BBI17_001334 [Phytophthora kernoviae]RLN84192.1 hypothetical protein BBO99_00001511 [Phytophthora kernoviae]
MVSADQKVSRVRLPSVPLLEDDNDTDSFIYEDDGESNDGDSNSQLCLYVQKLEKEKHELENEVQLLHDHDTSQATKLHATERRIEMLEATLKDAFNVSDTYKQEKDVILALHASERERMASLVALLEEAQNRYEDAERARQSAIFKLSSLQAARADASINTLLSPTSLISRTSSASTAVDAFRDGTLDFGERIEKYKRDIELLRQRLELTKEQAAERQKMAVSLALHEAQLDYSNVVEHMKLECERRLNQWRHEEAVRAKETESAMDEDRYSVRLEMKHALQRAQIDQRVAYLQAQTNLMPSHRGSGESDFSIGTLDEVLVRMQLEQLRTRRFEALKKALLIRSAKQNQAAKELFCRWKIQASNTKILRLNAVLHMHRIALHLDTRKKLVTRGILGIQELLLGVGGLEGDNPVLAEDILAEGNLAGYILAVADIPAGPGVLVESDILAVVGLVVVGSLAMARIVLVGPAVAVLVEPAESDVLVVVGLVVVGSLAMARIVLVGPAVAGLALVELQEEAARLREEHLVVGPLAPRTCDSVSLVKASGYPAKRLYGTNWTLWCTKQ